MFRRYDPDCPNLFYNNGSLINLDSPPPPHKTDPLNCERSFSVYTLFDQEKEELLSDYALPLAVVLMTVLANLAFSDIPKEVFIPGDHPPPPPLINGTVATPPPFLYFPNGSIDISAPAPPPPQPPRTTTSIIAFWEMPLLGQLMCMFLGCPLAILFFMDQLIVTNTVDNLQNNLKKGEAPNWDLVVVSLINVFLSVFGLLWMHGALPQAYLHLKSQADVEDRLVDGRIQEVIVKNRESRVAILLAHAMMIPTYLFLLPYLRLFPTAIFHGLFLYLAYTSALGNEFCQRLLLLFTEQRSYPPCHYNRQVPQKTVHFFTMIELLQLVVLLLVGFAPWSILQLTFPIVIFMFIPFRTWILPRLIDAKYLNVLDGTY
uniref:Bicarbonate transporter-like transmembrane domain-containing protein n=1 Tax=Ditylenchus dipsaci TaxID=166011 RepID=A0A915CTW9_9BILA